MILENWQIKILENDLLDYQAWINHVETCGKFPNPDLITQNKINKCLERMINQNSQLDFTGLTDEEIVNLIILQQNYKNREERENEI
jgi:hypothetical protein